MSTVVEYMPFDSKEKTEKMVDDLRTLGIADLQMQLMQTGKKQNS